MYNFTYSGATSPYEHCYATPLPAPNQLTSLETLELRYLANQLAAAYKSVLPGCTPGVIKRILQRPLELGIKLNHYKTSTTQSLSLRLQDAKWWRRKVIAMTDELQEHQAQLAGELGGKTPKAVCCSNKAVVEFKKRKEYSDKSLKSQYKIKNHADGSASVFSLYDISELSKKSRLNELFLDIKALEKIAETQGFGCAFITLTAAPEFHSNPKHGRSTYNGSTAKEANQSIHKDWKSVLDALDNLGVGRKSGKYFGFRVVELHDDGCPHWHILMFFDRTERIIGTLENSLARLYKDRGTYFQSQKRNVVRLIEKTDDTTAKPSSYIFKYIAFALGEPEVTDSNAIRYKCAIRAMGARQYAFFGVKCSMGKQRALKAISRVDTAPLHIKRLADELHVAKGELDRNARQLQARVDFLQGGADDLDLITEVTKNKYGEEVAVNRWIKHRRDGEPVQISGLCEDIKKSIRDVGALGRPPAM
ncbi:replication endonuclease [Pseudomonas sp. RTC3]|uniref:replication endonuclease n=1 Tax=Pseudomonas sp. 5C2 TaxID=3048588 RepID=UPI002AB4F743|nr:replication endonuclease [Pseudomonas sp. 5C2]MDY7567484.1 replication endonuclease [Pseudomonas sp. 5C2]MEB0064546.1 replication endonuclease [Pseudomonas sp. RTC3]MEB0243046.1 replication endonuclease [Pseudomonas sp. 5C2]